MQFCEVMETRSLVVGLISVAAWIFYMAMAQTANAQSIQTIDLKASPGLLQPQEFYIKQVLDGRKDKSTLGYVVDVSGTSSKKQPLGLEGGTVNAIEKFIHRSLDKKSTLRPVIFTIKELRIAEVVQPDGVVSGNVSISVIFETEKEIGRVKLIEYRGGTKYSRSSSRNLDPGPVISKNIGNALEYFDRWINREAPHNEKLAQGLELSISDVRARADKDTLFYNSRKSLSWSDFRSQPDMKSRFAAEVFPFFSFEESSKIENSIVHLDLKLKVYLVKNFSWVKAYARNSNTLNHEQRHFDIVKIASERFKKKLKTEKLTPDNYQGILSVGYLECLTEMNRLQEKYDLETGHGTNHAEQERWNRRIDEELRTYKLLSANQEE